MDATFTALIGLVLTAFAIASGEKKSSELAATAAYGVGLTLLASFAFEARSGLKNLVRADLMGTVSLRRLSAVVICIAQEQIQGQHTSSSGISSRYWTHGPHARVTCGLRRWK